MSNVRVSEDITLSGTVHISDESRQRVVETIREEEPDIVAIELGQKRLEKLVAGQMREESRQAPKGILQMLGSALIDNSSTGPSLLKYILQRKQHEMFEKADVEAGESDFIPAIMTAEEVGSDVVLIDSNGDSIFEETRLSIRQLASYIYNLDFSNAVKSYGAFQKVCNENFADSFDSIESVIEAFETISYEELNRLKNAADGIIPDNLMKEVVHDRDDEMAGAIEWCRQNDLSTVAVVGRMHVPGIQTRLESEDAESLASPPELVRPLRPVTESFED